MKRVLAQMVLIVLAACALGLGRNLLLPPRLPLFGYAAPPPPEPLVVTAVYQEADADLVRQLAGIADAVIVDARPADRFRAGHIRGAQNLPLGEFTERYPLVQPLLSGSPMVVVYCQSSDCEEALRLLQRLWDLGHQNLFLYRGGFAEWRELGYESE